MKIHPKVTCSGCGQTMPTVHPEKYHQICSIECREMIEDTYDELIDDRHAIKTQNIWIQQLIDKYTRTNIPRA